MQNNNDKNNKEAKICICDIIFLFYLITYILVEKRF
jgi:hypothetical protein